MDPALAVGFVLAMGMALPVRAQTASSASASDKVAAESLFEEGRNLVAEGKLAEACAKFGASEQLDPSSGTLLNLANCWERLGRTASAWATYRQAASVANAVGRRDHVATAQRHADALGTRLSRLKISVLEPVDGIEIRRDGLTVTSAEWGAAIPIDPGAHVLVATAPGRKRWTSTIDVEDGGVLVTLNIPPLEPFADDGSSGGLSTAPAPSQSVAPSTRTTDQIRGNGPGSQGVVALVVGGFGLASLGVGTGMAFSAKSKFDESLRNCLSVNHNLCNSQGVSEREGARTAGNVATVMFGVGAAALIAGGILWFTAPRSVGPRDGRAVRLTVVPTLGGALLTGRWE